jgi:serine/threonine-protein kinase
MDPGLGSSSFLRRHPALEALRERFEVVGLLGQGAMGAVYRARERGADREVALKVVLDADPEGRRLERFRREGQITASLSHPGIVKIHSAGDAGGYPYLAYELVEGGRTLADVLLTLEPRRRVTLVRDAARALGHAHRAGVVHRDVKPENLLVDADGNVRVADFGLAAAQGLDRMTRTGAMLGTPAYMSPEQLSGKRDEVGPQTDVWSLGVILYQALTGALPFDGANMLELGAQIMRTAPVAPRKRATGITPALEQVCLKALARRVDDRYVDAEELARDLDRALAGLQLASTRSAIRALATTTPRARWTIAALALVALLVAGGLVLVWLPGLPDDGPEQLDRRAPTLLLGQPPEGTEVWAVEADVSGEASDLGAWIEVVATTPAGRTPPVRVDAQGAFRLRVPLAAGRNVVTVEARDPAGNVARATRGLVRVALPAWFEALPPDARPALPLPPGLLPGAEPGEYLNEKDGSALVWIPAGALTMGADDEEPDERPAHPVRVTRGFFLGKFEVTLAQWDRFVFATRRSGAPERLGGAGDRHPFSHATFVDARDYCAWAGLRLPTEAEWELAARGPEGRRFPWGPEHDAPDRMNCDSGQLDDGVVATAPVGSFPRGVTPQGVHDLAGNVYEWVADFYGDYAPDEQVDPTGPPSGTHRVLRGGAYNCGSFYCRGSDRYASDGGNARFLANLGIRVAR